MHNQRAAHSQSHQLPSYDSNSRYKIVPEVQLISHAIHPAYKKQHHIIEGISVPCINMHAYQYLESDLLMTAADFNSCLFPNSSLEVCMQHLSVLKIQQYMGNR